MTSWWAALCRKKKPVSVSIQEPTIYNPNTLVKAKGDLFVILKVSIRTPVAYSYQCLDTKNNLTYINDFEVTEVIQ